MKQSVYVSLALVIELRREGHRSQNSKVRIKTTGPTLGSSNYLLQLDCYGYWDISKTADASGIIVADLEMVPLYDATGTTDFSLGLVNSLATMT